MAGLCYNRSMKDEEKDMKRSNKTRLNNIKNRLEAININMQHVKSNPVNMSMVIYRGLQDIINEDNKIMDSIEKEGGFDIKATTEDD